MQLVENIIEILSSVLNIDKAGKAFSRETPLLGSIPEFDSSTVVSVLTAIEEHFDIVFDDDEVTAELFETIGSFADFIEKKLKT